MLTTERHAHHIDKHRAEVKSVKDAIVPKMLKLLNPRKVLTDPALMKKAFLELAVKLTRPHAQRARHRGGELLKEKTQ